MSEGNNGARRTEDIALDLLKFVAARRMWGPRRRAVALVLGWRRVKAGGPGDGAAGAVWALPAGG